MMDYKSYVNVRDRKDERIDRLEEQLESAEELLGAMTRDRDHWRRRYFIVRGMTRLRRRRMRGGCSEKG